LLRALHVVRARSLPKLQTLQKRKKTKKNEKKTFLRKESLPRSERFGKANFKYIFAIAKSA
jgi:hypothetical protein